MLILLCTLILSACSTTGTYDEQLQNWMGVSEEHLIDNWGMPDSSFMVDANTKVITYVEYSQEGDADAYSDEVYYSAISGPNFAGPNPDEDGVEYCKISFVITNNEVTNYNYNGDYCTGNIMGNNK